MVGKCAEKAQEYQQDRIGGLVHPHEPGFSHSLPKDKKWRDKSPEYPSNHSLVQEKGICSASLGDITPPTLAPQRQPWSGGETAAGNIYPQSLSPGPRSGLTEPRAIKAMADLLASQEPHVKSIQQPARSVEWLLTDAGGMNNSPSHHVRLLKIYLTYFCVGKQCGFQTFSKGREGKKRKNGNQVFELSN